MFDNSMFHLLLLAGQEESIQKKCFHQNMINCNKLSTRMTYRLAYSIIYHFLTAYIACLHSTVA